MKRFICILLFSLGCLLQTACKKEESPNVVQIRIENTSNYRFDSVYVDTSGGENDYEMLNASEKTGYSTYTQAFRNAYVKVKIDGQELEWYPTDYVGETPLKPGKYTYMIGVNDLAAGRLSITLKED